jgi:hypothetical protein
VSDSIVDRAIRKNLAALGSHAGTCPDYNQISAYLENRCAAQETAALEEHFAGCHACREILAVALQCSEPAQERHHETVPARYWLRYAVPASALAAVLIFAVIIGNRSAKINGPGIQTAQVIQPEKTPAAPAENRAVQAPAKGTMTAPKTVDRSQADIAESRGLVGAELKAGSMGNTGAAETNAPAAEPTRAAKEEKGEARPALPAGADNQVQMDQASADRASYQNENVNTTRAQSDEVRKAKIAGGIAGNQMLTNNQMQNETQQIRPTVQNALPPPSRPAPPVSAQQAVPTQAQEQLNAPPAPDKLGAAKPAAISPEVAVATILRVTDEERAKAKNKKIQDRVFYFWAGYWIDSGCLENKIESYVTASKGIKDYEEIAAQVPWVRELDLQNGPVLLYWEGKVYIVRQP